MDVGQGARRRQGEGWVYWSEFGGGFGGVWEGAGLNWENLGGVRVKEGGNAKEG